ncbi:MAG: SDR family oxidoreductase [Ilumatobacteraceae bacterium]
MSADESFENVPVLVSGGAGGIGSATAQWFLERGARVAVIDLPGDNLDKAAATLGVVGNAVDLTDEASVRRAVADVVKSIGPIGVLVNAAGVVGHGGIDQISVTEWRQVLDINLTGSFILAQVVIPYMRTRGKGKIVFLSSVTARTGGSEMSGPAYAASKAGIDSLTRYLANLLAPSIQVNAVAPGPVRTGMLDELDADGIAALAMKIPAGRTSSPLEIAGTIGFLCSVTADYITGVSLDQNGGQWMG